MDEVLTLDGPAGSGKSSVARALAEALGWRFLDTGAMYRAFALHMLEQGLDPGREEACRSGLEGFTLRLGRDNRLHLCGRVIADAELRTPPVEAGVSLVAACSPVRERMRELQREFAGEGRVVAEGRDMGSVVFPRAAHKFYLEASSACRARRRLADFQGGGRMVDLAQVQAEIERRDRADREREDSPLVCAEDALVVDTTDLTFEQVVAHILATVRSGGGRP